ncbi:YncE family protein [Brevundimonas sp. FT23042]|uniref:YncE family protein n=1 Tax=Brevundimonas sp. FT23042 TaxID=3393749 RepID=UPI003B58AC35
MSVRRIAALGASLLCLSLASVALAEPRVDRTVSIAPGGLYELVFNPADNGIYIAAIGPLRAQGAARIIHLDGETLEQVEEIDVSGSPVFGLGLNVSSQTLYGTGTRDGRMSALDLRTGTLSVFGVEGEMPHLREVVVDEVSGRAYASVLGNNLGNAAAPASLVWVIENGAVVRVIEIDAPILAGLQLDASRGRLFAAAMGAGEILVIDIESGAVTRRFSSGAGRPTNLVHDAEGGRLLVANQEGGLTVLDSETGALLQTVATGEGALSVAYNPNVRQIYVTNRRAGTVSVIDSDTYRILADLRTGTHPQSLAVDRRTNRVYVTNKAGDPPRGAADPGVWVDPQGDTLTVILP